MRSITAICLVVTFVWVSEATAAFTCREPVFLESDALEQMFGAIAEGREEFVRPLLADNDLLDAALPPHESRIEPSRKWVFRTPLIEALLHRRASLVELLLSAGANPDLSALPAVDGLSVDSETAEDMDFKDDLEKVLNEDTRAYEMDAPLRAARSEPIGITPLGLAISNSDLDSVDALLLFGARADDVFCAGERTALSYAASQARPGIVERLIDQKFDPSAVVQVVRARKSPHDNRSNVAFKDDQVAVLRKLTAAGFDVDGEEALTATLVTIETGRADLLRVLLNAGVSPNLVAENKDQVTTFLMVAALTGEANIVELLLESGADVAAKDRVGNGLLAYAAAGGMAKTVELLSESGAPAEPNGLGQTALMMATTPEVVVPLIGAGVDVNAVDRRGRTALHFAVNPAPMLMHPAARLPIDPVSVVQALLEADADPDIANERGITPLMSVALGPEARRDDMALLLVEHGAAFDATDADGNGIVHHFANSASVAVLEALVDRGASITAIDGSGRDVVLRLIDSDRVEPGDILAPLARMLAMGADPNHADARGRRALHALARSVTGKTGADLVKLLLDSGSDPNAFDEKDGTPLMHAVAERNSAVVAALAEHPGTSIDVANSTGETALSIAARLAKEGDGVNDDLIALVAAGADTGVADQDRRTTFMSAIEASAEANALFLLETDSTLHDRALADGRSPLMRAAELSLGRVHAALLSVGADVCRVSDEGRRAIDYAASPFPLSSLEIDPAQIEALAAELERRARERARQTERRRRRNEWGFPEISPDPETGLPGRNPIAIPSPGLSQHEIACLLTSFEPALDTRWDIRPPAKRDGDYYRCVARLQLEDEVRRRREWERARQPLIFRDLWALDVIYSQLRLLPRHRLQPDPETGQPVASDFPSPTALDQAVRDVDSNAIRNSKCDGQDVLFSAALLGDVAVLDEWFEKEMPLYLLSSDGFTPSVVALRAGHQEAVETIAENADRVLQRSGIDVTALQFREALNNTDRETSLLFVESSLDKNVRFDTNRTALMLAAELVLLDSAVVRNLLQRGADPDLTDDDGKTALIRAVMAKNESAVRLLVSAHANPDHRDRSGLSAREYARELGIESWISDVD